MNAHWSAQDVERFREQQRWRMRQKTNVHQPHQYQLQHQQHQQLQLPTPTPTLSNNAMITERLRKVSLKFRDEHEQFLRQHLQPPLSPHASALARATRPAFAIVPRRAESPVPHTAYSMFNAFDSTASPEAFSLADASNQDEHRRRHPNMRVDTDNDHDMASDEDDDARQQHLASLWRRRFVVQAMEKRSPKLGRVALWEAAKENNQCTDVVRVPLPFADDNEL